MSETSQFGSTGESGSNSGEGTPTAEMMDEFIRLYGTNQTRITIYVRGLVNNATAAEEILQETSYILWREFKLYKTESNFLAWACSVAYNQMLAWRKKQLRDKLVFSEDFLQAINDELIQEMDNNEKRKEWLRMCMEKLPKHHKQLIHHRYTLGEGVEMIAKSLGRSANSVYRMLSRVRDVLHECVNEQQEIEFSRIIPDKSST